MNARVDEPSFASLSRKVSSRQRVRIAEKITEALGIAIVNGRQPAGASLTGALQPNLKLDFSPTAYTDAVKALAAKGLVECGTHTGNRIAPRRRWLLDEDVLRWSLQGTPDEELVQQVFELRERLEPHAAELAAKRRSPDQLAAMANALEELSVLGLACEAGRIADRCFHQHMLSASRNRLFTSFASRICVALEWTTLITLRSSATLRDPIPPRKRLYDAIFDTDPKRAFAAAQSLIRSACEEVRASLLTSSQYSG